MNLKTILALGAVLIIIAVLVVIGRTRSAASDFNETVIAANNGDAAKTDNDESFVPLAASENAAADARDVLIAANKREKVIRTLLAEKETKTASGSNEEYKGEKIVKTEAEWRKILTKEQFHVLREKGTERAFTGEYTDNHEHGEYSCAACHLKLFSSAAKFDSGTGWASFYQPVAAANVTEETDSKFGMSRTEVLCSRCHSHLGHVFDDGPKPTGLRYCMNSAALKFEKQN